jgi:hypothetical protein
MRRAPQVTVTIDRLVLRGFPADQRDAIAGGLAAELRQQLAARTVGQRLGTSRLVAATAAQQVRLVSGAKPDGIGLRAAQALIRSLRS